MPIGSPRTATAAFPRISYLAAEAVFKTCETAMMSHGGMGYAKEFHVERYLREALIMRIAPVTAHMILNFIGEKVLGLPGSY
jgi:acyl-CoA dehydrogenase